MITRAELKLQSKMQLRGKWGRAVLITLIVMAITLIISLPYIVSQAGYVMRVLENPLFQQETMPFGPEYALTMIASIVVNPVLYLGLLSFFLKISRNESPEVMELFSKFNKILKVIALGIMINVFTILWSFLFFIPGIIAAYRYRQAYFILLDNPDISIFDAIRKSKQMMMGHKLELFILDLSFIGWAIISAITLWVGYLWLEPYMYTTYANYYNQLNGLGELGVGN